MHNHTHTSTNYCVAIRTYLHIYSMYENLCIRGNIFPIVYISTVLWIAFTENALGGCHITTMSSFIYCKISTLPSIDGSHEYWQSTIFEYYFRFNIFRTLPVEKLVCLSLFNINILLGINLFVFFTKSLFKE